MSSPVLDAEHDSLEWQAVESSNLEKVAYVPYAGRLWVKFLDKDKPRVSTYYYLDVPIEIYEGLLTAESKGKYLHQHVKKPGYGYVPFR